MFDFLSGTVRAKRANRVTLENAGIGYLLQVPTRTGERLAVIGSSAQVYITMRQPEGEPPALYGFIDADERDLFELLISVSGVGPQAGMNLLSRFTVAELAHAITDEDFALLATAKRVGPKTAKRLVVETRDKVERFLTPAAERAPEDMATADAISALESLGYSAS
jgi:Holliday junction DNA helicase RuvA